MNEWSLLLQKNLVLIVMWLHASDHLQSGSYDATTKSGVVSGIEMDEAKEAYLDMP